MNFSVMVINLDDSPQRMDSIAQQCQQLGLGFTRVSAVNGKTLDEQTIKEVYNPSDNLRYYDKLLNKGEIACYLSHIKCWQEIVDKALDFALILEDDAFILENIHQYIDKLSACHQDWDYIKLSQGSKQKPFNASIGLGDGLELCQAVKLPSTTTGQLVSNLGAKRLLASAYPIVRPVDLDIQFWFAKSLRCFVAHPLPIKTAGFKSDIGATANRNKAKKHPFRRLIQRIRYELLLWTNKNNLPEFPSALVKTSTSVKKS